jgi:hypothetical protein
MHLVFMTRGVQHVVDMWHTQMQSQYFPWKRKNLDTGQETIANVQGALRPIQLWEYVFPEEHLDVVLNSLEIKPGGKTEPPALNKYAFLLRKGLGLKSIPDDIKPTNTLPIFHQAVHIFPIGIKEDLTCDRDFGVAGKWHQEML